MALAVTINNTQQATLETGTTVLTGTWNAIYTLTDTVFTTLTGLGGDSISGVTFPANRMFYGNFTAVTLASGSVILYEPAR